MSSHQPHILLQLYYSIQDNIRFHEHQIARLEQRTYQIQQEIINILNRQQQQEQEPPFILRNNLNRTPTRRRNSSTNFNRRETQPIYATTPSESPQDEPAESSTSPPPPPPPPPSAFSDNYSFNYVRTYDSSFNQPLATSFARSLLNRSSLNSTSTQPSLSDPGTLLLYFMLENIHNETIRDEQHGITDPSLYITDMIYGDVDNPANSCCPIQMDVFTDNAEVSQINKCKHIFCRREIRRWLETHHTCPLCRTPIDE